MGDQEILINNLQSNSPQIRENAIIEILKRKDDFLDVSFSIPYLLPALRDMDQVIISNVAMLFFHFAHKNIDISSAENDLKTLLMANAKENSEHDINLFSRSLFFHYVKHGRWDEAKAFFEESASKSSFIFDLSTVSNNGTDISPLSDFLFEVLVRFEDVKIRETVATVFANMQLNKLDVSYHISMLDRFSHVSSNFDSSTIQAKVYVCISKCDWEGIEILYSSQAESLRRSVADSFLKWAEKHGDIRHLIPFLEKMLFDDDPRVSSPSAKAILSSSRAGCDLTPLIPALCRILEEESESTFDSACEALKELGKHGYDVSPAIPSMLTALTFPDYKRRIPISEALETTKITELVEFSMVVGKNDSGYMRSIGPEETRRIILSFMDRVEDEIKKSRMKAPLATIYKNCVFSQLRKKSRIYASEDAPRVDLPKPYKSGAYRVLKIKKIPCK